MVSQGLRCQNKRGRVNGKDMANFGKIYPYIAALISWAGTYGMIAVSTRLGLLDNPNARSSHETPTPRGAGVAVFIAVILGSMSVWVFEDISGLEPMAYVSLILGGGLVAWIGWLDDRKPLSAKTRLIVHFSAAFLFVFFLTVWNSGLHLSLALFLFASFLIVLIAWAINLTNFMDGLNGILGVQALTVSLAASLLALWASDRWLSSMFFILFAAMVGFLPWNWGRAKIFMGDVGSGFIGFWMSCLFIFGYVRGSIPMSTALILNSVFLVDTGYTLISRTLQRKRIFQAHKSHAYQKLNQRGWSHSKVSLAVGVFNFLILFPYAYLTMTRLHSGFFVFFPFFATALMCFRLEAGREPLSAP